MSASVGEESSREKASLLQSICFYEVPVPVHQINSSTTQEDNPTFLRILGKMSTGTPEVIGISRSGRVRKKSTKLMEMEESETTDKQTDKKAASITPKRTPKSKPVKLKMTFGGAPICEVFEDGEIPMAECTEVFVVDEPPLEIVKEDVLPLPPITMKLSASKGTSQLGPSIKKSFEIVGDVIPPIKRDGEFDTPKSVPKKRKIEAATIESDKSDDLFQSVASSEQQPTSTKKVKKSSGEKKPKKPPVTTGYTLWTRDFRPKIQQEHPEMDFAAVSRRLGEIWQSLSNNEKLHWKIKAQKLSIRMTAAAAVATPVPQLNFSPSPSITTPQPPSPKRKRNQSPIPQLKELPVDYENKMKNIPMSVAAHLKVLGESMSSIGHKLSQQNSQDLASPLSDLLDSLLCSLDCLMFLTCVDPKLNGCPLSTHHRMMDNVGYIMPGV